MKRICLLALTLFLTTLMHAQTVNGIPIQQLNKAFIELNLSYQLLKGDFQAMIDYGQERNGSMWGKETYLRDNDDKPMRFNSAIDAINFLAGFGYEVHQVYTIGLSNVAETRYILKKSSR